MNTPTATVLRVDDRVAVVRVDDAPVCPRCAAGQGCGAGLGKSRSGGRELTLERPPGLELETGDKVNLTLTPSRLLRASLLGYGLPLACLVLLPLAADALWGPFTDLELALLAIAALAAAVAAGRRLLARDRCLGQLAPGIGGRARSDA